MYGGDLALTLGRRERGERVARKSGFSDVDLGLVGVGLASHEEEILDVCVRGEGRAFIGCG